MNDSVLMIYLPPDPTSEYSSKEIKKRQAEKIGFTRPEFCVMLSYAKMEIYQQLLSSDLLNDSYLEKDLISYFPKKMQKDFSDEKLHPADLKLGTSKYLNEILERVRIRFKEKDELLNKAFS